jgi:enoyl-CoA hydratase/carnithine racemase
MLWESVHLRITAEYGIGTLWLAFPGSPVNALNAVRLKELESAVATLEVHPFLHTVVVRSAKPAGFCAGLHPNVAEVTDRLALAALGQRVLARLAALPMITVALLEGPCCGAGLELALACDYRLCVATPTTLLGFPERFTCFGGGPRLRRLLGRRADELLASGRTLSGREARAAGLVDRAFCARRAKIELRTFLDELERRPPCPWRKVDDGGWVAERRAFAQLPWPPVINEAARCPPQQWDELLARGFITPLEAETLRQRRPPNTPSPWAAARSHATPVRPAA